MSPIAAPYEDEDGLDLRELLGTLLDNRWLLATITLLCLLMGGIYAFLIATPIYRADALLHIESTGSSFGALEELTEVFDQDITVSAEIGLIRSRLVLGQVVDKLKLDIVAKPKYLPIVGEGVARHSLLDSQSSVTSLLNLSSYALGLEHIRVDTFDIPRTYLGQKFIIITLENQRYQLAFEDQVLLDGQVGETVNTMLDGEPLTLFIATLTAEPGVEFELQRIPRLLAIRTLNDKLKVSEQGKQSKLLELSLDAAQPLFAADVLNQIANTYLRQNVERRSEEANSTLNFLEKQLPTLKEQLNTAEAALNNYRLKEGSVDLPRETQVILEKIVNIESKLTQLGQERPELLRRFTDRHPRVQALDLQISALEQELKGLNQNVQALPQRQQEILRLSRDVEVNSALYSFLLNKTQELRVVKAGTIGNVRIVDYSSVPIRPVKPRKLQIGLISLISGLFLGIAIVFLRRSLNDTVEDPKLLETQLSLPIYATVPHSKLQEKINKDPKKNKISHLLAVSNPSDLAVESLRSLRTALHFGMLESRNNIVMITSPGPNAGKSFISANLGALLADSGKKVLLVDADMRRGHLHHYFSTNRSPGLSELLAGEPGILQSTDIENLDFIPTGNIPSNPSELLQRQRCAEVMKQLTVDYDLVLIDTPPALVAADAAIIGQHAGTSLLAIRAKSSPLREIEETVKRLKNSAGVKVKGVVFNDMSIQRQRYGYGKYYGYSYTYSPK